MSESNLCVRIQGRPELVEGRFCTTHYENMSLYSRHFSGCGVPLEVLRQIMPKGKGLDLLFQGNQVVLLPHFPGLKVGETFVLSGTPHSIDVGEEGVECELRIGPITFDLLLKHAKVGESLTF